MDCFQQNPTIFNFIRCYISEGFRLIDKLVRCLSPGVCFLLWLIRAHISTLAALERFPRIHILEDEAHIHRHVFTFLGLRNDDPHRLVPVGKRKNRLYLHAVRSGFLCNLLLNR